VLLLLCPPLGATRRAQSEERGGQHIRAIQAIGYIHLRQALHYNNTYYTASMHVPHVAQDDHRAGRWVPLGAGCIVWNTTSHTHKTQVQVQVEHQVEHLHQELNSPCETMILQLEQWAHLALIPFTNADCSYTNSASAALQLLPTVCV
jgi:hypothetical protein